MRNNNTFSYARDNWKKFICNIARKEYLFRVSLLNPDARFVEFNKAAVKELYINDNIFEPVDSGYIIIDNREDVIERFRNDPTQQEFNTGFEEIRGYRTRGDARDLLFITIIPIIEGQDPFDVKSEQFNAEFGWRYTFVLEDEEDVILSEGKAKKYKLIDFDEEVLREKRIFFSTGNFLHQKHPISRSPYNATDSERSLTTGSIMKNILNLGLNNASTVSTIVSGGKTITPNFESGSSTLFFSSPGDESAWDNLMYIYNLHVSGDSPEDFSILKKGSWAGEYTLENTVSIFSKAYLHNNSLDVGGLYYQENITITGASDKSNVLLNDAKKPLQAIEFGETGNIIDVKFTNSSGRMYQENIRSIIVHSYDFNDKEFTVDEVSGDIQTVKDEFTQFYVNTMKGKNGKPYPNMILNETQKSNKNYENVFNLYDGDVGSTLTYSFGRNRLLKNALLLNIGVEITVEGSTHRRSGKFLSIDRSGNYIDNDFDNKFLGIYFIIDVTHKITNNDTYVNKIIAVKTYHFIDPKFNESTA